MSTESENDLLQKQYKLAIEARDKLNENHHKWMTYYYIANAAILVAITSIFKESKTDTGIFVLSLLGILTSIFWNLSCKGYYYWSLSWINIIWGLENKIINENISIGVYSVFSKKINDENLSYSYYPLKEGNISTVKLTLLFSFCAIVFWTAFSVWQFRLQFTFQNACTKNNWSIFIVLITILGYCLLPRFAISKKPDDHRLVERGY